jgi:osmotically-inducible protein OsmY
MNNPIPAPQWAFALALILACTLSGCATFGKCDSDSCRDDAKITKNVDAALDRQPDLFPPNSISVQTVDHVVYLNGLVEGSGSETAEAATDQVPGVSSVVNSVTDDTQ